MMAHLSIVISLFVIYQVFEIAEQTSSKLCTLKPYIDECGNHGWLWNCSQLNMQTIHVPRNIPDEFRDNFLAIDLSKNTFTTMSTETFANVSIKLLQRVTALYLQYNNLKTITKSAFGSLRNLCVLDLSHCKLEKMSLANQSFADLSKLKILRIHYNEFKHQGYPDTEISRILTLESLTIGAFESFHFNDPFRKLKQLKSVNLYSEKSKFHLTNTTFVGLSSSPIHYLEFKFRRDVFCDISEEIFCSFPILKGVHIEFGGLCDLNVALLSLKCLQNRTMEYIVASGNVPIIIEKAIFLNKNNCKYLFTTCTKRVSLIDNRIDGITDNPLKTRMGQCVEYLDLSRNRIEFVKAEFLIDLITKYPRLQVLNVSCNANHPYVGKIFNHSVFYRVNLKKRPTVTFNLSKRLIVLDDSKNVHLLNPSFPFDIAISGEGLQELYLAHSKLPCKYVGLMQTPSLEILDISEIDCSEMHCRILRFSKKLERFLAKNASFGVIDHSKMEKLFIELKRLKFVDLSHNSISNLPHTVFEDQKLSLSTLNLDYNKFSKIPVSQLQKLEQLYMRYNKISFFAKSDIDNLLTLNKDLNLFIKGNPISCECAHISSLKRMRENHFIFGDLNDTQCISNSVSMGEFLQEKAFIEFEKKCQANLWLTWSSVVLVLLLNTILMTAFVKKYRVHVDYVIFRLRSRWKGIVHVVNTKTYRFDAFVSYAEEDYDLACAILYQELKRLGFEISLPDVDFIPGKSKAKQLLQCIDESRKVIIIVTENFLKSGWNSYAVQMVVTHAFHNHRDKSIIVIIKDGIAIERMHKDLRYIWWSIISIRWPETEENMNTFWEELSKALHLD